MAAITPDEAREYLDRWSRVERLQTDLDRQQTPEARLHQLAVLMASRELFARDSGRDADVEHARLHWLRVRAACGG